MMMERYGNISLAEQLLSRREFEPYPTGRDRKAWERLPRVLKRAYVGQGERYLSADWPSLPATLFMEFQRKGIRSTYERASFQRRNALAALVVAECIEGEGRFLDAIVNGVWAICEETFWGIPAHTYLAKTGDEPLPDISEPVIDLFAGETGALLAWTHYLLEKDLDAMSPLVTARIRTEVKRRILDPFVERDDFWWMGLVASPHKINNWNPWCNSNVLAGALLLEDDPNRRTAIVTKVMRSLDRFIASYQPDGGCDEGPGYWNRAGGSLFDCLELLHIATSGALSFYDQPLIAEIGRYLYRVHIFDDYFINFADAPARVQIPAGLVYQYGCRIGDEKLAALGAHAYHKLVENGQWPIHSLTRLLPSLFLHEQVAAVQSQPPPYEQDAWLEGIQVMVARERGQTSRGLFLAAKGGHNGESHNHNDVGQFVVYLDGQPMVVDVGVETYTAKTFSSRRYEIWTMQSHFHNVPAVGGVGQRQGGAFKAGQVRYHRADSTAELSLDLATAYPPEAGIESWRRTLRLVRGEEAAIEILDDFKLSRSATDVVSHLMTPCAPQFGTDGTLWLKAPTSPGSADHPTLRMAFDATQFDISCESIPIEDPKLAKAWGSQIHRIRLVSRQPVRQGVWRLTIAQANPLAVPATPTA